MPRKCQRKNEERNAEEKFFSRRLQTAAFRHQTQEVKSFLFLFRFLFSFFERAKKKSFPRKERDKKKRTGHGRQAAGGQTPQGKASRRSARAAFYETRRNRAPISCCASPYSSDF